MRTRARAHAHTHTRTQTLACAHSCSHATQGLAATPARTDRSHLNGHPSKHRASSKPATSRALPLDETDFADSGMPHTRACRHGRIHTGMGAGTLWACGYGGMQARRRTGARTQPHRPTGLPTGPPAHRPARPPACTHCALFVAQGSHTCATRFQAGKALTGCGQSTLCMARQPNNKYASMPEREIVSDRVND